MIRKTKIFSVALFLLSLIVVSVLSVYQNHDSTDRYIEPLLDTVTLDQLLESPFVTEGSWSFMGTGFLFYKGEFFDTDKAKEGTNLLLAERVREIFKGHTLHAVELPTGERNYNSYINELLGADRETIPLYLYLGAGTPFGMQIHDGDMKPTHISIVSLDGVRCYLDISYKTEPEHEAVGYVFFTDEPKVIQEMMALARDLINGVEYDENHAENIDGSTLEDEGLSE